VSVVTHQRRQAVTLSRALAMAVLVTTLTSRGFFEESAGFPSLAGVQAPVLLPVEREVCVRFSMFWHRFFFFFYISEPDYLFSLSCASYGFMDA
jgi:hypothetical protein